MLDLLIRNWWTFLVRGIVAILFGVGAFVWPGLTVAVLIILFGAFAFADGILAIVTSVASRKEIDHWWAYLLEGIAGVAIGVLTFFWPGVTAITLLFLIAAWAIITGIFELIAAFRLREVIEGELWLGLSGVLSILFGVLLVARPGAGALAVIWLIGAYAIAFGIVMIVLAFKLRRLRPEVGEARSALGG